MSMRKPGGYAMQFDDTGIRRECDTATCSHCNKIMHIKPMQRAEDLGGLCKQCMGLICPHCVNEGNCDPMEKKLQRWEAADRLYRDMRG